MKKLIIFILFVSSINTFSQVVFPDGRESVSEAELKERGYKMAIYPGGMEAFRNNFAQIFDSSRINSKGTITTEVQFIISEEGNISDVVVAGESKSMNNEMARAMKKMSKTKWKPAEIDGQPVKYRFKFPMKMSFE